MEDLKHLSNSRKGYRLHMKKLVARANDLIERHRNNDTELDSFTLTELRDQLQRKDTIISNLNSQISKLITDEEQLVEEICETEEINELLSTTISRLSHIIEALSSQTVSSVAQPHTEPVTNADPSASDTAESNTATANPQPPHPSSKGITHRELQNVTRLPKLSIPVFSGNTLQWQSFWDCFEAAVDHNTSITGVQKLNYLRGLLQGNALRVITGLPLTNANYDHAVQLLKKRYGKPDKLIEAHMQALADLSNPSNTLSSLQLFHDSVEGHIRSLQSLGTSHERYESMLIPVIQSKLPADIRRNLKRSHGATPRTLDDLMSGILIELEILESGADNTNNHSGSHTPTASFLTGASRKPPQRPQEQKRPACVYCGNQHAPNNCTSVVDQQKRLDIIKRDKLCFNCLGHHKLSQCKSRYRCRHCNHRHHTSLCNSTTQTDSSTTSKPSNVSTPTNSTTEEAASQGNINPQTASSTGSFTTLTSNQTATAKNAGCLLKTAVATVTSLESEAQANILFDEGSQRSFLIQELADALSLQPHHQENIHLASFGSKHPLTKKMEAANIHIKTKDGHLIPLSVLIVPTIAAPLRSTTQMEVTKLPYLRNLPLAHPVLSGDSFKISLLIGTDHYWDIVEDHIVRGQGPTAMSSKLGYLLSGPLPVDQTTTVTNAFHVSTHCHSDECDLTQFWQLESAGTTPVNCTNDKGYLTEYIQTSISRQPDGSYCAKLPWKASHKPLSTNREICKKRAQSLIHRLSQTPKLLQSYDNIIREQAARGFIEKVQNTSESPGKTHYIPHHCVKKNSTTTPIRIVYDCSCRQFADHPSLNDCLLTGPHFLNDLCSILLRFRLHKYAISADIEKAFLQITLHEDDRNFTRFYWLSDPSDPTNNLDVYRFKTVLFGAVSSPFILYATLYHHLTQHNNHLSCDILHNLYVDNVLSGCSTEADTINYYTDARALLSEAHFNLRAWVTNSPRLRAITEQEQTANSDVPSNVLGLLWNPISDELSLVPKRPLATSNPLTTKRELLKESSKLFDPIGITTPVTIQAKILIQKVWTQNIDWDEPLGTELAKEWQGIAEDLAQLHQVTVKREYFNNLNPTELHIHAFSDASIKAYGAVVYLCSQTDTTFVIAKSRVAPLKSPTLPRLELTAALTAARLVKFTIDSLELPTNHIHIWADSQIALYWIHSSKKLPEFVSNRVSEINRLLPLVTWKYCPSSANPADLLTRGLTYKQFQSSTIWFHGPPWLPHQHQWPTWHQQPISHLHAVAAIASEFIPEQDTPPKTSLYLIIPLTKYSSLRKLLAVTAYVNRFIQTLRNKTQTSKGPLTAVELDRARVQWIHACQQEVYWREIKNLSTPNSKRLILVRQLRLFLDKEGFLRCGGRIHNAPLDDNAKFPCLLPPRHHFTRLIVYATHTKLYHTGVTNTVTSLRQTYWIPTARQYVKSLLRHCTVCRKHCGKPYPRPDPAPLPKNRVQDLPPFTVTGVDFTGALYVHDGDKEVKVYICLFTCANTRAVHLEVVSDLSTDTFILAFRRFASRKSLPQIMMSDNASTYAAAAEEVSALLQSEELDTTLGSHGVVWKFIPKKAPWFGGFWERMIGLTKNCLRKVLGRSHVSLPVLQTMVVEVEAILNDRPLTYTPSEVDDPQPLTPAHLLYGRMITRLPHECLADDLQDPNYGAPSLRTQTKTQAHLLKSFQTRWKHEYLTSLREYHRLSGQNSQQIKTGDVVLVHDEGPRVKWRLAVITKLIAGGDGLIRAAEIRTSTGTTNRPIAKLFPLEVNSKTESIQCAPETQSSPTEEARRDSTRPPRQSARRATEKMSRWIETLRAPPEDVETYD